MIGNFLGYFEKPHSYGKTDLATVWVTFGKMGYFLLQHLVTLVTGTLSLLDKVTQQHRTWPLLNTHTR